MALNLERIATSLDLFITACITPNRIAKIFAATVNVNNSHDVIASRLEPAGAKYLGHFIIYLLPKAK
jgi:hypothetical protein